MTNLYAWTYSGSYTLYDSNNIACSTIYTKNEEPVEGDYIYDSNGNELTITGISSRYIRGNIKSITSSDTVTSTSITFSRTIN